MTERSEGLEARQLARERFGDLLRTGRESRRWSQVKLAEEVQNATGYQTNQSNVSQWERGMHSPRVEIWPTLEKLVNLEPGTLALAFYGRNPVTEGFDFPIPLLAKWASLSPERRHRLSEMLNSVFETELNQQEREGREG